MLTWYHYVWLLFPLLFFLLALWSKLEQASGRTGKDRPGDLVNQAFFVLLCVVVSILFDIYALPGIYSSVVPDFIPLGLLQFLLLPFILLLAAMFLGPSKEIRITRAPNPTKSRDDIKRK